jgi:hypothetical protein
LAHVAAASVEGLAVDHLDAHDLPVGQARGGAVLVPQAHGELEDGPGIRSLLPVAHLRAVGGVAPREEEGMLMRETFKSGSDGVRIDDLTRDGDGDKPQGR